MFTYMISNKKTFVKGFAKIISGFINLDVILKSMLGTGLAGMSGKRKAHSDISCF